MKTFKHYNASTLKQATSLLSKYGGKARVNAGGTDLLGGMRDRCTPDFPEALINIKGIHLDYIKSNNKGLKIGALAKLADIVKFPEIKQHYPLLAEATHSVASPNLRNMATIGGNLAQDVRCWYYRYPQQIGGPIECLRKGGRICNALAGDNRYHSIFGAAPAAERRCASHCPAHINIPAYVHQVGKGNLPEAARILMDYNPIPAITGRVCPIFCEPQCNRGAYDDPIAVHCIEREVGDYILDHAAGCFSPPKMESGRKVAIVGSGPAGLAAAYYLRKSGHQVVVYERMTEPGGMLLYSIPPYRLPKKVVRNQIQALKSMGVCFELGVDVGKTLSVEKLKSEADAVFLAGGTWKSLRLGVPGEDGQGVCNALDYLRRINSGEKVILSKKVIVIGGGSVAIDAARTARRTGSEEVHIVCLETRNLESKDRMPALEWEILEAEEEGIIIHPSLGIRQVVLKDGMAAGVETMKCTSVREPDGRFNPQYDASGPALGLQAESIIIAIGQSTDGSLDEPGLIINRNNSETGVPGVFTGGDMASGPSTVIQAVASARDAVLKIEQFLGNQQPSETISVEQDYVESSYHDIPRIQVHERPPEERIQSIDVEDMPGQSLCEIETEARRCVNCSCLAIGPSDLATALVALDAKIVTTKRALSAQAFFTASLTASTVLDCDELIKEIQIPKPHKEARQSYLKFTLRKPVDFALASVASVLAIKDGICTDARIVLGAVAPAPIRASMAEEAIKGKPVTEREASEAAELAMAGAHSLSKNAYKVRIAKTLVKRSILGISE